MRKNGNTAKHFVSYLLTSRKLVIQLGGNIVYYCDCVLYPHETSKANGEVSGRNV